MSFFPVESGRLHFNHQGLCNVAYVRKLSKRSRCHLPSAKMRRSGNENGVTRRLSCASPMRFKRHSSRARISYSLTSTMCFQSSSKTVLKPTERIFNSKKPSILGKYLSTTQNKPCFTEQTPIQTEKSSVSNSILSRKLGDNRSLSRLLLWWWFNWNLLLCFPTITYFRSFSDPNWNLQATLEF